MEPTEVVTTVEPTIVEATPSEAQIVEQSTPMDSNVTYNNISEPTFNPGMEPVQNLINDAVTIEHDMNVANNAGKAMNNFLTNKYDYNKNEAGTYWVAGAINDTKTQMSFLQTLINEEMYDEMDLQKYYYDTNLATARAYAAQKEMETAYGFYRAAQEKALAEANLTGWYMPAEGQYLLGQYTAAQRTIEDPDATPDQLAKANRITKTAEEWFAANQITTRGIKCLSMLQFEETVRNNTVMAKLEDDANKIAANQNAAASAMAALNLREFKYSVEEAEMLSGRDFTYELGLDDREGYIGHHYDDYEKNITTEGYKDAATMLVDNPTWYSSVLGTRGKEYVDNILKANGYDSQSYYNYYSENAKLGSVYTAQTEAGTNNFNISEKDMNKLDVKTLEGKELYSFAGRVYAKNDKGEMEQVKQNIETSNGKTIAEVTPYFTTDTLTYENKTFKVGANSSYKIDDYEMGKAQRETVKEYMKKGYHIKEGYYSTQGIDAAIVMENEDGELIEVSNLFGEAKSITSSQIATIKFDDVINSEDLLYSHLVEVGTLPTYDSKTNYHSNLKDATIYTTKDAKGNNVYYVYAGYLAPEGRSGHSVYEKVNYSEVKDYVDDPSIKTNPTYEPEIESATRTFNISYNEDYKSPNSKSTVTQKEAVDNLNNYGNITQALYGNKGTKTLEEFSELAKKYEEEWEESVKRAGEAASKTTTPVPTLIGEGKQGKTINDLNQELNKEDTDEMYKLFKKHNVPEKDRLQLLIKYPTKDALEEYLRMNEMLGKGR